MMYYHSGYGPGYGAFGLIGHVIGIVIAVMVIIWIVRMIAGGGGRRGRWHGRHPWWDRSGGALEILNERYAKGEIDKAEYEERKKALMN